MLVVQRWAGWLLAVGGMLAVAGAFTPPYRQWSAPLPEALRVIASHPIGWRLIHAGFVLGTLVSLFGLAVLAYGTDAGLGWLVLRTGIAPTWTGWLFVVWGLSAGFVLGSNVPFIAYVPFAMLGSFLIRAS